MRTLRAFLVRLGAVVRPGHRDRQLADELNGHLELAIEDHMRAGLTRDAARRLALVDLGGFAHTAERCREPRGFPRLEATARDIGYAVRRLRRNRAFTTTAGATLALAIGVNTAMFSVLNAVLLRPLPFRSPEQLAMIWIGTPGQNTLGRPAFQTVEDWRRQSKSFADIAVLDPLSVTLTDADGAEKISVARVSANFFPLLGIQPVRGRIFSSEEGEQRQRLAVISDGFWRSRFGRAKDALGASVVLDGLPSQIIGILPPGFETPFNADVWEPHTMFPDWEAVRAARGAGSWFVVARLRPDATVDRAQSEMSTIARSLDAELPAAERNRGVTVIPLSAYVVGPRARLALWLLTGAVFCVLLIAAANVASLSLARGVARGREIAVRSALGASRLRIVRQLLAESVTLAAMSGVLGALLAVVSVRLIRALAPATLPRLDEVSVDPRVLGWALAMSLLTGIVVGLAPALTLLRRNLRPSGIHRGLVMAEFALAVMLLAGAGLLVRSWMSIERVDPGFRPERVLSMQLSTSAFEAPAQRAAFYARALEQVESLPGVESAGIVGDLFIGSDAERIVTSDQNAGVSSERMRLRLDEASERFFTTLGTPLLRGRFFSADDGPDAPRVAIVNEKMARDEWPGREAVGSRIKLGAGDSANPWLTVVGVVGDMRRQGPESEPIPQIFVPLAQDPSRLETLLVRTSADDPLKMVASVRAAVRRVDKYAPIYAVATLDDRLGAYLTQRRFQTSLLLGFSVVALLLTAIGIHGLIHYSVATRTREIGIRTAIGAHGGDIVRMIVGEGLQLSVTGLLLGLAGAFWAGRAASSLLFGVTATDPLTFITVSLLLTAVAVAASYFPARRATRLDPVAALRYE